MDIAELRQKPHLSASGINDYLECGLRYKFVRIDKISPYYVNDSLLFGSTIHKVLADFNNERLIGTLLNTEQLKERFAEYWKKAAENNERISYSKGNNYASSLIQGHALVDTFAKNFPDHNNTVIAVEEPFYFRLDGIEPPIIGVMDLVEQSSDGNIIITDYKTSSKSYTADQADNSFQLTIYYIAAQFLGYRADAITLKFDCLIKTQKAKFEQVYTQRSLVIAKRAIKRIYSVWQAIKVGVFIPNDGQWKCKYCEFKPHCDQWMEA